MTPTSETLIAEAAQLTPKKRIQVVERILNSLDQPDAALDVLWANDASDRLAAYRRGEIKAVGLPDVIAKYQQSARYWKNQLG